MRLNPTLQDLAAALANHQTTSRRLVEVSLERIADPTGEGARAFIKVDADGARAEADRQDSLRKSGRAQSRFAGIPFSVKDLFDLAGQVTTAGSKVLSGGPPALADAPAIAVLKEAGFVVLGRTNMTEFAYSGVGLNPHYGTPRSVYDRAHGRIPGGSTSGGALSVADGMCALTIGSDTGGSCRIAAAYNGIVGFKPSASRVSTKGAYPLSPSFDSIGPLANSVACCASVDALMAGDWDGKIAAGPSRPMRLGVLQTYVMAGLDAEVAEDYALTLQKLRAVGAELEEVHFDELLELPKLLVRGGIVGFEASKVHGQRLLTQASAFDPRVSGRILVAAETTESEYQGLLSGRAEITQCFGQIASGFDAIILPTVANVAPLISALDRDEDYFRLNSLSLRNTYIANFVNACAISLPMHEVGKAPTGLMLMAPWGADHKLLSIAAAIDLQL